MVSNIPLVWRYFYILVLLNILTACASTQPQYLMHQTLGEKFLNEGKYIEAISEFSESIKLDPNPNTSGNMLQSIHRRSIAYFYIKKYDDSLKDLTFLIDKGLAERPDTPLILFSGNTTGPDLYFNRGIVCCAKGDVNNCLSDYEKSITSALKLLDAKAISPPKTSGKLTFTIDDNPALLATLINTYKTRSDVYAKLGKKEDAQKDIEESNKYRQKFEEITKTRK